MKALVDPLLWFFIIETIFIKLCWQDLYNGSALKRSVVIAFVTISLLLLLLSLTIISHVLKQSLIIKESPRQSELQYIFVLGAGYFPGDTLNNDTLYADAIKRTQVAISLWNKHPQAILVMQGAENSYPFRQKNRAVELMATYAKQQGVAPEKIKTESESLNTREHPYFAKKHLAIDAHTPISVVTSDWHLRRARQEFKRYFSNVRYEAAMTRTEALSYKSFLPSSLALLESTLYVREWVGLFWYQVYAIVTGHKNG